MNGFDAGEALVAAAHGIAEKRLSHGRTGNVSARDGVHALVTPTGIALADASVDALARIDIATGSHLDGPRPTKEAFLHAAMLRARPGARVIVHTHSTYAAAVSCLDDLDDTDALPPLTAYFAMRVGRLPALPYHAPGDQRLGELAERAAAEHHALLLRNHGPIVAASDAAEALDILEELEETARISLLLRGMTTRPLTEEQAAALRH